MMTTLRSTCCLLVVGMCLSSGALSAQAPGAETDTRNGGFGGPVVKFTQVDDRFGVFVGGRGGWIIDGSWVIGGGGYSLANVSNFGHLTNAGDPGELAMAYGGVEVGYVHRPDQLVHVALGLLVGAGGLVWTPDTGSGAEVDDGFFVAEPEVDVVVAATSFLRVTLGVSYRLIGGVELLDLSSTAPSGFAGLLALKFGSF